MSEDPTAPDNRPDPFPIVIWDILAIAVCVAVVLIAGMIGLTLLTKDAASIVDLAFAALILEAVAIVASIYVLAVHRRRLAWADIGLRPITASQVRRAVIVGLLCFALVTPLLAGLNALFDSSVDSPQSPFIVGLDGFSWSRYLIMLVLGGAIVPFAEELFFRGLLYGWMRKRWSAGASAFASAAVFGAAHPATPALAIGVFAVGLALAIVYERTGTLWASIVVHAVFNATSLSVMFAGSAYGDAIS